MPFHSGRPAGWIFSGGGKKRQVLILRKAYRKRCREAKPWPQINLQRQHAVWPGLLLRLWIPAPAAEFQKGVCPQLAEPLDMVSTGFHYVKRHTLVFQTGLHLSKLVNLLHFYSSQAHGPCQDVYVPYGYLLSTHFNLLV